LRRAHENGRLVGRAGIDAGQNGGGLRGKLRPGLFENGQQIGHETVLRVGGKSCSNEEARFAPGPAMIGKLKGVIDSYGEDYVIVDVHGVGYQVHSSARTLQALPARGEPRV